MTKEFEQQAIKYIYFGPTCLAVEFMSFKLFLSNQASQGRQTEKKSRIKTNSRIFKITFNFQ